MVRDSPGKEDRMTILTVKDVGNGQQTVSYPVNHPDAAKVDTWLENVSPGYVYDLQKVPIGLLESNMCPKCRVIWSEERYDCPICDVIV